MFKYILYAIGIKKRLSQEQKMLYKAIINQMIHIDDYFNVCRIHNLWYGLRRNKDIEIFRGLHCVRYRDMTPEIKKQLEKMLLKPLEE